MTTRKIAVNSTSTGKFKTEVINNRPHLVTEMVSIEGESIMNGLLYPLTDVKNSFSQLDSLPAPAGHPTVNGMHVGALNLFAINANHVGGMVRNPRMVGNQVINELVFDLEVANKDERGKAIIDRIEKGESIGVSTGLNADVTNQSGSIGTTHYEGIVSNIKFDHVAVLLNEPPAGDNTFTINADEQTGLLICNISEVIRVKTVGNSVSAKTEENDMDKLALALAIIGNSSNRYTMADKDRLMAMSENDLVSDIHNSTINPEPSMEQAQAVVTNAGLAIQGADFDKDAYGQFMANKDVFAEFLADKDKARTELVAGIVANSKMTKEQVEVMADDGMTALANSIVPQSDYSANLQTVTNNDRLSGDAEVDYTH